MKILFISKDSYEWKKKTKKFNLFIKYSVQILGVLKCKLLPIKQEIASKDFNTFSTNFLIQCDTVLQIYAKRRLKKKNRKKTLSNKLFDTM